MKRRSVTVAILAASFLLISPSSAPAESPEPIETFTAFAASLGTGRSDVAVADDLRSAASGEVVTGAGRLQARPGNRGHRRFRLDSLPDDSQLALRSAPAGPREKSAEQQKEQPDSGQPPCLAVAAKEIPRGHTHEERAEEEDPETHDSHAGPLRERPDGSGSGSESGSESVS